MKSLLAKNIALSVGFKTLGTDMESSISSISDLDVGWDRSMHQNKSK
jgi:hypothetical protein